MNFRLLVVRCYFSLVFGTSLLDALRIETAILVATDGAAWLPVMIA